ncbi:hypothetical protein HRI_000757800 [Hibiscus trionum]|uniref:Uncharacterized protein n=1 Tax=Hibiscus trionum TaxID=183268 RepID=A0A9W7H7Q3_HIBTR|nr:hypothetical protein HRI_000757800 [Hibiscus trionum]
MNSSQAATSASSVPPNAGERYPTSIGSLHIMIIVARTANSGVASILFSEINDKLKELLYLLKVDDGKSSKKNLTVTLK